jgi:hypothetical protein
MGTGELPHQLATPRSFIDDDAGLLADCRDNPAPSQVEACMGLPLALTFYGDGSSMPHEQRTSCDVRTFSQSLFESSASWSRTAPISADGASGSELRYIRAPRLLADVRVSARGISSKELVASRQRN